MDAYEQSVLRELRVWQMKMTKRPSLSGRAARKIQTGINRLIPQQAQTVITLAIKNMVMAVLAGSEFMAKDPLPSLTLRQREEMVREKITFYKRTASLEGAGTGAGGILLGLADFPLLLSIKIKFLFDVASIYGFTVKDLRERLYILHLFQLAFSSASKRKEIYAKILNWDEYLEQHPVSLDSIDWQAFQQEYRDYIDLAKMLQLVPGIGAVVGAYANYKLLAELGKTAMNGYRLRLLPELKVTARED